MKREIIVFTDGSCIGNGTRNTYGGIGIHFPNKELKDVSKVYRLGLCTNQKAELYAILIALRYIKKMIGLKDYKVVIKTDSKYSINSVTKWIHTWMRNGWKTITGKIVANREFIEIIHKYYKRYDISFEHVESHTGMNDPDSIANARADELATRAARRRLIEVKKNKYLNLKKDKDNKTINDINNINLIVELIKSSK